jgi:hypothetical protein
MKVFHQTFRIHSHGYTHLFCLTNSYKKASLTEKPLVAMKLLTLIHLLLIASVNSQLYDVDCTLQDETETEDSKYF